MPATAGTRRVALLVEYDGTDFAGSQAQPQARTVQTTVEAALVAFTGEQQRLRFAGRTDAGVHARGQVVTLDTATAHPPERFCAALNRFLPPKPRTQYLTIPPALIVEVASRWVRRAEIDEKIEDYRRAGVLLIWYLFPEKQEVWVEGAGRDRVVLGMSDVLDGSDVLPGLPPIPVADLFR